MAYSTFRETMKMLQKKPIKLKKFMKHSVPKERSCGFSRIRCRRCFNPRAIVRSYGIVLCRQCFRENAKKIGFKQYS